MDITGSLAMVLKELDVVISGDLQKCEHDRVANRNCVSEILSFLRSIREVLLHFEKVPPISSVEVNFKHLLNDVKRLQSILNKYKSKRRLFWAVYSRNINKEVEDAMRAIEKTIVSVQLANLSCSQEVSDQLDDLIQNMSKKQYEVHGEQRLAELLDDKLTSELDMKALAKLISTSLGLNIEKDKVQLCQELRYLKHDLVMPEEYSNEQERRGLMNIVEKVLEAEEGNLESLEGENEILPPFDAFECPLLKEIMEDPVVLQSEHTYERRGIEEWFKSCREQNREPTCPVSGKVLTSTEMLPNLVLRQTIEEWYQRNVSIRINILRQQLKALENNREIEVALDEVLRLANERRVNKYKLKEARLVPEIAKVWTLVDGSSVRAKALAVLIKMATDDVDNQHAMADNGVIRLAVKSLGSKDDQERVNAAKLIHRFSEELDICFKLATEKGAIIHLDKLAGSTDKDVAILAERTLKNMEHDSNVFQMAEAGRLDPLLSRLASGPEMTQIQMAKYLAEKLTVKRLKELCAKHASHVLIEMLSRGLDAKEASLGALLSLSSCEGNSQTLIQAGLVPVLLSIMFSIQTSLNTRSLKLKEDAATILATLVSQPSSSQLGNWQNIPVDEAGNTLDSEFVVHNILGLLAHVKPDWKDSLLQVLYGIASAPRVSDKVCKLVCSGNGLVVLIPLLQTSYRLNALKVLGVLSVHMGSEVLEALEQAGELGRLQDILKYKRTGEQAAVAGLVSNLPLNEDQVIRYLGADLVGWMIETITDGSSSSKHGKSFTRIWKEMVEGILGVLVHFVKCNDRGIVNALKEQDVMVFLLNQIQRGQQSSITKQRSLVGLKYLSEKAAGSSGRVETPDRTLMSIFSALCMTPKPVSLCPVHGGICGTSHNFCLVENKGIIPLLEMLEDDEESVQLACVEALSTVISDSVENMKGGLDVLVKAQGTRKILDLFYADTSLLMQERVLWILERLLRYEQFTKRLSMEPGLFKALVEAFKSGNPVAKLLAQDALTNLKHLSGISAGK